jgi:hypothetical protein
MKVDYLFLADAGQAQRDTGLFTVLNGGVNLVRCSAFPGGVHTIFLLGRVSFDPNECAQKHLIDVDIVGPLGPLPEPVFRKVELFPGKSELGDDRRPFMTLALTFQSIVFPSPGVYTFRVLRSVEQEVLAESTVDVLPLKVSH